MRIKEPPGFVPLLTEETLAPSHPFAGNLPLKTRGKEGRGDESAKTLSRQVEERTECKHVLE